MTHGHHSGFAKELEWSSSQHKVPGSNPGSSSEGGSVLEQDTELQTAPGEQAGSSAISECWHVL